MFFHSALEYQTAKVYGITDAMSVTLLNRDHPFPLLVEEEERVHGALLINTTHGALFRTLSCISDIPNTSIEIEFKHTYDESLPSKQVVLNTIKFLRDQMALDAVQCHEGFAKHIAYATQFELTSSQGKRAQLEAQLEIDRKTYRILDALCTRVIHPIEHGAHLISSSLAYTAAKVVLNTNDIAAALEQNTRTELWQHLKSARFAADLEARAMIGVGVLEEILAEAMPANLTTVFVEEEIMRRLRKFGFDTPDLKDSTWLIAHTALLGKRIETLAKKVFCSETAPFIGWTGGKNQLPQIDRRFLTASGDIQVYDKDITWRVVIESDPALRVLYPPLERKAGWEMGNLAALTPEEWDKLAIYVTPAFEPTGEPAQRQDKSSMETTLRFHLYCFGLLGEQPKSMIIAYVDWWAIQRELAAFDKNQVVIVSLEPVIPGPTISMPPIDELAEMLGAHANVIYWKQIAGPGLLTEDESFVYEPQKDVPGPERNRGPRGVFAKRANHSVVSCVPKYVIDLVNASARRILNKNARNKDDASTLTSPSVSQQWTRGALLAYELMYERAILPGPLPYFSGLDLFRFLKSDV